MSELLLSFDIEEFDVPLENGIDIPFAEQMRRSVEGTEKILDMLKRNGAVATLFCTANFAKSAPDIIKRAVEEGHEIASHGFYHSQFEDADLLRSKELLEEISGTEVSGFRMARMMPVSAEEIRKAGYVYNSSLNPTIIPGRYNNLSEPRLWFNDNGLIQLPTGVTPKLRFPLFWLALHNLPLFVYNRLLAKTLKHDGYTVIYFHPWEFTDLKSVKRKYRLSPLMTNRSGDNMVRRLEEVIKYQKHKGAGFSTISDFLRTAAPSAKP